MSLQGSLSIERMCQMVPVSRRSFYRSLKEQQPVEEEMEVRSTIQQIALEHRRRYGYRRITAELHRRGMQINHKRVVRIMQEDNLLGLQPRRFKVTTDSSHKFEVYLNLAARMREGDLIVCVGKRTTMSQICSSTYRSRASMPRTLISGAYGKFL
jgi:putative transposase